MAVWQWDVCLIPRSSVLGQIPEHLDLGRFDSVDWWHDTSPNEVRTFLASILPAYATPWAQFSTSWGSDDGDRITLMVEDSKITDLSVRIDLRDVSISLLKLLVDFAHRFDCLFFSIESEAFVHPELDAVLDAISRSRKMTFVNGPKSFFADKKYLDKVNREAKKRINGIGGD